MLIYSENQNMIIMQRIITNSNNTDNKGIT